MKTLNCTTNESVPWRKGTWHITVKDDIALQFSWYFEIRKQYSNVVRLPCVYTPKPFDWHSNVWDLIHLLDPHANSYKTDRNDRKVEKSVSMHSNDHTNTNLGNASHMSFNNSLKEKVFGNETIIAINPTETW